MNLHPPAHLHAQSHNSHNSQHSQHSNQSNQSQQQQQQSGVNVDDMFHQETGLDDADDEDDGDGESFFFSPPPSSRTGRSSLEAAGLLSLSVRRVVPLLIEMLLRRRVVGLPCPLRRSILPVQSVRCDSARFPRLDSRPHTTQSLQSHSRSARVLPRSSRSARAC